MLFIAVRHYMYLEDLDNGKKKSRAVYLWITFELYFNVCALDKSFAIFLFIRRPLDFRRVRLFPVQPRFEECSFPVGDIRLFW